MYIKGSARRPCALAALAHTGARASHFALTQRNSAVALDDPLEQLDRLPVFHLRRFGSAARADP